MDLKKIIKPKAFLVINLFLIFVLLLSMGINQAVVAKTYDQMGMKSDVFKAITGAVIKTKLSDSGNVALAGNATADAIKLVISQGVPEVYGPELAVSYDAVQQSMNVLLQYDPTYGKQKIVLTGDDLNRYIDIGSKIACEYCCGATSIVFKDGQAACGCAHSQAMRGLAAYLIKNHGAEYTNDQILRELARWKGMFFPKQMIQKMAQALQDGKFNPDIAALVMGLKLPDYGSGGKSAPLPSDIENLPGMVGGC